MLRVKGFSRMTAVQQGKHAGAYPGLTEVVTTLYEVLAAASRLRRLRLWDDPTNPVALTGVASLYEGLGSQLVALDSAQLCKSSCTSTESFGPVHCLS